MNDPKAVIDIVARVFGVSTAQILGPARTKAIATARQTVCFILRRDLGMSSPKAGDVLALDHSTVVSATHRIEHLLQTDTTVADRVAEVRRLLAPPSADRDRLVVQTTPLRICVAMSPDGRFAAFGASETSDVKARARALETLGAADAVAVTFLQLDIPTWRVVNSRDP
jgi:hypothetical protein